MGSNEEITVLSERRGSQSSTGLPPLPTRRSSVASNTDTYKSSEQAKRCPTEWTKESLASRFQSYKGYGHLHNEVTKRKLNVKEKGSTSYGSTFYLPSRKSARSRSYSESISMGLNADNLKPTPDLYQRLDAELDKVFIRNDIHSSQVEKNDLRKLPKTINSRPNKQYRLLRRSLSDNDVIEHARDYSTQRLRYKPRPEVKSDRRPPLTSNSSPKTGVGSRNFVNGQVLSNLNERVKSAVNVSREEEDERLQRPSTMWRMKEGPWEVEKKTPEGRQRRTDNMVGESMDGYTNNTRIVAWLENCEKARQDLDSESVITLVSTVPD